MTKEFKAAVKARKPLVFRGGGSNKVLEEIEKVRIGISRPCKQLLNQQRNRVIRVKSSQVKFQLPIIIENPTVHAKGKSKALKTEGADTW
mmetsp:Transcript_48960/g.83672  ORF Transcript_48960/g.83672 Transcript_48960/m.83672 type:complete len:90 (-) Transcript_48960:85-354(-)